MFFKYLEQGEIKALRCAPGNLHEDAQSNLHASSFCRGLFPRTIGQVLGQSLGFFGQIQRTRHVLLMKRFLGFG